MKSRIIVIGILVIAIAALASGAYAYFTTEATAAGGTVTTGTLDIEIASNADDSVVPTAFADTAVPPWDTDLMVPGDKVFGCLWVKNTGDVDVVAVTWDFVNLNTAGLESGYDLADRLQILDLYTSDSLYDWPEALYPGGAWYSGGAYGGSDSVITLREMADWSSLNASYPYDWLNDDASQHFLLTVAPDDVGYICMEVQMINGAPEVDNNYQGATFTYDIEVTGFNPSPY